MSTLPIPRTPRFHLVFPLALIAVGVLLLVQAGTVSADAIGRLVMVWPLLLVMLGIELVLERTMPNTGGRVLAGVLIAFVAMLGIFWALAGTQLGFGVRTGDVTGPTATAATGTLLVNAGGARVTIAGDADGSALYRVKYSVHGSDPDISVAGGTVTISANRNTWGWTGGTDTLDIHVSPAVAWAVQLNLGAAETHLDLTGLSASSLRINAGAGSTTLRLGRPSGTVPVDLRGGAMSATIEVPAGVQAQVVSSGAVSSFNAPGAVGGTWRTDGYATAADRYDVTVTAAASSIRVVQLTEAGS